MNQQGPFDLRNLQGFRRRDLENNQPRIICQLPENEAVRHRSTIMKLLILMIFLPYDIVCFVEQTVGWPDIDFGNQEGGHTPRTNPEILRQLTRLVQALRDISSRTWTSEIQHVMQSLEEYKWLLGKLLDDMTFCRGWRSSRSGQPPPLNLPIRDRNHPPEPNPNGLTEHANALEVLLAELGPVNGAVVGLDHFDQHILTVHQVIELLS